jgi:release factor glutamine methyltransferase
MSIRELVDWIDQALGEFLSKNEVLSHRWILIDYFLGMSRAETQLNVSEQVDVSQEQAIKQALEDLKGGKPIDYIVHESVFLGYPFYVDERVLIPRTETEETLSCTI